jgi:hypothetical protein
MVKAAANSWNRHFNGDESFVDTSGVLVRRDEGPEGERERGAKL